MRCPPNGAVESSKFVFVTGTGTGVGKTVVTSALARLALDRGDRVAVVKPVQTGFAASELTQHGAAHMHRGSDADPATVHDPRQERPDIEVVRELSGCQDVFELVRLADPLAPDTAARLRHLTLPPVAELASGLHTMVRGSGVESRYDVVLVEGAGGVAVRLDTTGGTVLTLADEISAAGHSVEFVVVTSLALGTLNSTELTVQAIRTAGLAAAGLVFGNVPDHLDLAERCNLDELPRVTDLPVLGRIPRGVGSWEPARFRAGCAEWLAGWSA